MVGLSLLSKGKDPNDIAAATAAAQSLDPKSWSADALRGEDVGQAASIVAAMPPVRAQRRMRELAGRGSETRYGIVLADFRQRDERDRSRPFAPLVPAADAFVLDTSDLDIEQAVAAAIAYAESRVAKS
jgi:cytidylate kinase